MAHKEEELICPNCSSATTKNYCAQCGQENHLHNETFWGLTMHFIGHYFHYDSKLWTTLRTMWLQPGALTIAYHKKQRMRYIPPISLYIFVAFVFFFSYVAIYPLVAPEDTHKETNTDTHAAEMKKPETHKRSIEEILTRANFNDLSRSVVKLKQKHPDTEDYLVEKIQHYLPRIFFFMIPAMALILQLLFYRQKKQHYVSHAIFSLHYHTFWFSIWTINVLIPVNSPLLDGLFHVICCCYFVAAMRNVYTLSWPRAIFGSITTGMIYALIISLVMLTLIYVTIVTA